MARRLAAILAADIVGYSLLMGQDETDTLDRLKALRTDLVQPEIKRRGGRIVKLMGDGLLAEFPSIVEAVECAVDIQKSMPEYQADVPSTRKFNLRIGINLGDIIIEGSDIYGDGVNVAARLESLADVGGICISGNAFDTVQGKIELSFKDIGRQSLKNIAKSVQVYRLYPGKEANTGPAANAVQPTPPATKSIAVLPFDNMSGDAEQEYFSDGISEDVITDLSKVSALFVVARNSSFSYKGSAINILHVARDLGVQFVVEGSVRKIGNRVRITAQLIDGETGGHVWADRYDRELDDVFAVQDEITSNIVNALQLVLLPEEVKLVAKVPTSSFQAYDYYLKGRQCSHFGGMADFVEAMRHYESAIECDPKFARAYCGLADCGTQLYFWNGDDANLNCVVEAISQALSIDPDLAEAHTSLGYYLSLTGKEGEAEREFAIATKLDPNLYEAHYFWGHLQLTKGELEKAAEHFERAWKVSPRDPETPGLLLGVYRDLNRIEELEIVAQRTLEIGLRKLELQPDNTRACMSCAFAYLYLGDHSKAKRMSLRAIQIDPGGKVSNYNAACLYALLNLPEKALDYLEETIRDSDHMRNTIMVDGDFASLRDHPRYLALIERSN